jgi:hypothetical protein
MKYINLICRSLETLIAYIIIIAILATALQTPVEIAKALGYKWACRIVNYFEGD